MRFLLILLLAGVAQADCPPPPNHDAELSALIEAAQSARSEAAARSFGARMWALWADAPDELAQSMLDRGQALLARGDFAAAGAAFQELVEYCPDYAEGYNQRGFARYLSRDFTGALADLDLALVRSPRHVAALAGRALTLMELGRLTEARVQLHAALALNPWLSERHLLADGGRLAAPGEDI